MTRARRWLGLGLALMYLFGALTGAFVYRAMVKREVRRMQAAGPDVFYAHVRATVFDDLLRLDRGQRKTLESILRRRYWEIQAMQKGTMPASSAPE